MFETQLDEICLFPLQNKKNYFTFDDRKADEVKKFGRAPSFRAGLHLALRECDTSSWRKVFAEGGIVLVMDDFDRENECDMIALGETLTKEQMAFIIRETTGIVSA